MMTDSMEDSIGENSCLVCNKLTDHVFCSVKCQKKYMVGIKR